jgi:hypothetical protein
MKDRQDRQPNELPGGMWPMEFTLTMMKLGATERNTVALAKLYMEAFATLENFDDRSGPFERSVDIAEGPLAGAWTLHHESGGRVQLIRDAAPGTMLIGFEYDSAASEWMTAVSGTTAEQLAEFARRLRDLNA